MKDPKYRRKIDVTIKDSMNVTIATFTYQIDSTTYQPVVINRILTLSAKLYGEAIEVVEKNIRSDLVVKRDNLNQAFLSERGIDITTVLKQTDVEDERTVLDIVESYVLDRILYGRSAADPARL